MKTLDAILNLARSKPNKRLVVVYPNDAHTIEAVHAAVADNIVDATLVGDPKVISQICNDLKIDINDFHIIEQTDPKEAGLMCCDMINQGKAQLIMKGTITSDEYMRCLLNKERGLMSPGSLLTHITVVECVKLKRLLIVGDVAVIPYPNVLQKEKIIHFLIDTAHKLGIPTPRVALIAPSEIPSMKIISSADAVELVQRAKLGAFPNAIVDGPMGFDLAIDSEAVAIKKYKSPVGGKADAILFPNIDAGNVFYKTNTKLCGNESAAIVVGAKVPAVLTSRGDSAKSKLCSIALASVTTNE